MYGLLVALAFGAPAAASLLAGVLAVDGRRLAIPSGAGCALVVAFAVLLLIDDGETDPGAAIGGILGFATAVSVVLGAAFAAGVCLQRAEGVLRLVLGLAAVVMAAVANGFAALVIGILAICSGQEDCP